MLTGEIPEWYEASDRFKSLANNSKRNYRIWLKQGLDILGHTRVIRYVTYKDADYVYKVLAETRSRHKAYYVCSIMSVVWSLLVRHEIAQKNPFSKMKKQVLPHRTQLWTPEQVDQYTRAATKMGRHSMALLAGMCYTFCQRPIDIRLMKRESIQGSYINFVQTKTKTPMSLWLPVDWRSRLQSVLSSHDSEFLILNEDTQRPYDSRNYHKLNFDIMRRARLPLELQLRDLRRTGLTEAANGMATDAELMSLGGHTRPESLKPYRLNTRDQAKHALQKRFGYK